MGKDRSPEEIEARKAKKENKKATKAVQRQASGLPPAVSPDQAIAAAAAARALLAARKAEGRPVSLEDLLNPKRSCHDAALKAAWSTMPKIEKRQLKLENKEMNKVKNPIVYPKKFPFETASSDHCETSPEAYSHIVPLLRLISKQLGKTEEELQIYDPYYCSGAVQRHLAALGFPSVYNKCEDFYERIATGSIPEYDVIVSNPPYSEDAGGGSNHVARLLRFCVERGKPFLLNMPEYVASSAYYAPAFAESQAPLLLAPLLRYYFWTPPKLRKGVNKKAHRNPELGIRCSPFVALWYVSLEPVLSHDALLKRAAKGSLPGIEAIAEGEKEREGEAKCRLCRSLEELPESRSLFKKKPQAEGDSAEPAERPAKRRRKKTSKKGVAAPESADQPPEPKKMKASKKRRAEAEENGQPTEKEPKEMAEAAEQPAKKKLRKAKRHSESQADAAQATQAPDKEPTNGKEVAAVASRPTERSKKVKTTTRTVGSPAKKKV